MCKCKEMQIWSFSFATLLALLNCYTFSISRAQGADCFSVPGEDKIETRMNVISGALHPMVKMVLEHQKENADSHSYVKAKKLNENVKDLLKKLKQLQKPEITKKTIKETPLILKAVELKLNEGAECFSCSQSDKKTNNPNEQEIKKTLLLFYKEVMSLFSLTLDSFDGLRNNRRFLSTYEARLFEQDIESINQMVAASQASMAGPRIDKEGVALCIGANVVLTVTDFLNRYWRTVNEKTFPPHLEEVDRPGGSPFGKKEDNGPKFSPAKVPFGDTKKESQKYIREIWGGCETSDC